MESILEPVLTTTLFVAATVLFVILHVIRSARQNRGSARHRPCPRCRSRVLQGSERCPACGVPLQAFELVLAKTATAEAAEPAGARHAIVRADACVGCGACVAVCPEPGAIRLEGKMAVVDKNLCKGHGQCADACPVNGIIVAAGAAVQRIETPDLNAHFESNVPGLYVVGELGGRGLIKNAINEGKIAVERVASSLRQSGRRHVSAGPGLVDLVVVGSGPAGLSAGLEAMRQQLSYELLERGDISDTIRRYPRHKILMAEPVRMPIYGDLWVADSSKESLLLVWKTIVARTGLQVHTGVTVERIVPRQGFFEVMATGLLGEETYRGRHVVLALGRRGTPRRLEVPGEELPKVFYDVVEMEAFAGARVLVVGGGDSAIEVVVGLTRQEGTKVTLSYRGEAFTRLKERNREHFEAERKAGRVEVLLNSRVRSIAEDSVVLDVGGRELVVANDYVIVRVGGVPPFDFLRAAGVRIVTKEISFTPADAVA